MSSGCAKVLSSRLKAILVSDAEKSNPSDSVGLNGSRATDNLLLSFIQVSQDFKRKFQANDRGRRKVILSYKCFFETKVGFTIYENTINAKHNTISIQQCSFFRCKHNTITLTTRAFSNGNL